MKKWLALVAVAGLMAGAAYGSIVINNATSFTYSQNFNTLKVGYSAQGGSGEWVDNSTIGGWWWDSNNSSRNPDSYGYIADRGNNNTGSGHSYGADGSSERAMGALSSSGTDIMFGVRFYNNSGSAIPLNNILISYVGEQWRQNTSTANTLAFSYAINSSAIPDTLDGSASWTSQSALDFTAPKTGSVAELDGNLSENRVAFSNVALASSGSLNNGEYLMLRWKRAGTNSPGLAVDDFKLEVIPEPAAVGLMAFGLFVAGVLRRQRS